MWFQCSFIVLTWGLVVGAEIHLYKGFKVYEVIPTNNNQTEFLHKLSESDPEVDFWKLTRLPKEPARCMVTPGGQHYFENMLKENGINFSVINSNLSANIKLSASKANVLTPGEVSFRRYMRFDEMNAYLDALAIKYPKTVKVEFVGKSYEGRPMKTIIISNGDGRTDKKVIFIEAGIHARDWLTHATAFYVINRLVERSQRYKDLLKDFDWLILPVVNPDGYEYSHTDDRYWRKTRRPNKKCNGTNGDRNFDYKWGMVGASPNECHSTYKGPHPFSEPETKIVRDIMHATKGRCKLYISLHSSGRYIMYPWAWTSALPANWKDLEKVARAGARAVCRNLDRRYCVGSIENVLYKASGTSRDYAFAVAKIPIVIELVSGGCDFDHPPCDILELASEGWVAIKAMAEKVIKMNI